jgi:hypothetical protein
MVRFMNIENPMVIDALWDKSIEPRKVGECEGCHEEIYEGEEIYELDECGINVLIHQESDCCQQYVASRSCRKVAGE